MSDTVEWACDAYGPAGIEHGALCFLAGKGERACASHDECVRVMASERRRLFRRMNELAATGDPTWAGIESEFASPDDLLGGK